MTLFEPFEPRRLFAAPTSIQDFYSNEDPQAELFFGTVGNDVFHFSVARYDHNPNGGVNVPAGAADWIKVTCNRFTYHFRLLDLANFAVDGRRGNDVIAFDDSVWSGTNDITLLGGAGNDLIVGSSHGERIFAGDGNDTVLAGDARDTVYGEAGDDLIRGNGGSDLLNGNDGFDSLRGDAGNDNLDGGASKDRLNGSTGNDQLYGGGGNDICAGEDGDDSLSGGKGIDVIHGGADVDFLRGDADHDLIFFNDEPDDFSFEENDAREIVVTPDEALYILTYTATGGVILRRTSELASAGNNTGGDETGKVAAGATAQILHYRMRGAYSVNLFQT
jgi:Ca2+-binding RTX toxin-like protein